MRSEKLHYQGTLNAESVPGSAKHFLFQSCLMDDEQPPTYSSKLGLKENSVDEGSRI